jgi:hypothetical protein
LQPNSRPRECETILWIHVQVRFRCSVRVKVKVRVKVRVRDMVRGRGRVRGRVRVRVGSRGGSRCDEDHACAVVAQHVISPITPFGLPPVST